MSLSWGSFNLLLFLLCTFATYCQYNVHEACQLMDMCQLYLCEHRMWCCCFFFVSPIVFFIWLLTASSVVFSPFFLSLSIICVLFSLFTTPVYHPTLNCVWGFFSFLFSHLPLHLPGCGGQETSGLSSAVGCGRYGEDEGARLEVCVYVPAGVLQRSGDKGPG